MKEVVIDEKYTYHKAGVPIRIPPYLRRDLAMGKPSAEIQICMIHNDPHIGERSEVDTLPTNVQENIRLRRIARAVSRDLVSLATNFQAERYVTVVHGSLSRGLVRHPSNPDHSDIDIDLIIDNGSIPQDARKHVREAMFQKSEQLGARVDTYVWNMAEIKRNTGLYARYYMSSSAYPIANKGSVWEEVRWIGIESQQFRQLDPQVRKKVRRMLPLIARGRLDEAFQNITRGTSIGDRIYNYFLEEGLLVGDKHGIQDKAGKLCLLFDAP